MTFTFASTLTRRKPGIVPGAAAPYLPWHARYRQAMVSLLQILLMILGIVKVIIFIHFIMSWLISFQVLNIRQPFVYQVWSGLNRLLEPVYGPIRRILPDMGGLDLSPLVALVGVYALEIVIRNALISVI